MKTEMIYLVTNIAYTLSLVQLGNIHNKDAGRLARHAPLMHVGKT